MSGKIHPLTTISPVRWYKWLLTYGALIFLTFATFRDLRRLQFVHFARWVLLRGRRLPRPLGVRWQGRPHDSLLLFSTNFNGPWEAYLDAFARTRRMRRGVNVIWWGTPRFPHAKRLTLFKQIVRYFERPPEYYYSAYPEAGVRDIAAALRLDARLAAFSGRCSQINEAGEFGKALAELLVEAALDLRSDLDTTAVDRRVKP